MFTKIALFSLFACVSCSLHGMAFRLEDIETYDVMDSSSKTQKTYFKALTAFILKSLRGTDRIQIRYITGHTTEFVGINKDAFNELVQLAQTELDYAKEHPKSFEKEAKQSITTFNEWDHRAGKAFWEADYELLSLVDAPKVHHEVHPKIIRLNFNKMLVYISNPSFFSNLWALF
ncbi:hypothetical protein K2W90_02440 [Candidatus Babeliales bacterium]|nr:hypothetical protein [Candidatus Babeliales bacterium]